MLSRLTSNSVLEAAYTWLCHRRRDYPANADIWSFRRQWRTEKIRIQADLLAGEYRFDLLDRITLKDGSEIDLWSSRDPLVLKALTIVLADVLPVSPRCTHIKGNGGAKGAVRQVMASLGSNSFVMRTDVKSYYASIDHLKLMDLLSCHIRDRFILNLLGQYLRRTAERGGSFWEYEKGISLGCPLSPLIGAFYLHELDQRMKDVFYVRYMDDILVLAPTRWRLRRAVKKVNEILSSLGLQKHPDKTYIGKISNGFEFLGYHFTPSGLGVAKATYQRFVDHSVRLYEQKREREVTPSALDQYVRRWKGWFRGGLGDLPCSYPSDCGSSFLFATPADEAQDGYTGAV